MAKKKRSMKGTGPRASAANLVPLGNTRRIANPALGSPVELDGASGLSFEVGGRLGLGEVEEGGGSWGRDLQVLGRYDERVRQAPVPAMGQGGSEYKEGIMGKEQGHEHRYDQGQAVDKSHESPQAQKRKRKRKRVKDGKVHKEPFNRGRGQKATASNLVPLGHHDRLNARVEALDTKRDVPNINLNHMGSPELPDIASQSGLSHVSLVQRSDLDPSRYRCHEADDYIQYMNMDIGRLRIEAQLSRMPSRFLETGTKEDIARWVSCLRDLHALSEQERKGLLERGFASWAMHWGKTKLEQDSFLATTFWAMGVCRRVGLASKSAEEVLAMARQLGVQTRPTQPVFETVWAMELRKRRIEMERIERRHGYSV